MASFAEGFFGNTPQTKDQPPSLFGPAVVDRGEDLFAILSHFREFEANGTSFLLIGPGSVDAGVTSPGGRDDLGRELRGVYLWRLRFDPNEPAPLSDGRGHQLLERFSRRFTPSAAGSSKAPTEGGSFEATTIPWPFWEAFAAVLASNDRIQVEVPDDTDGAGARIHQLLRVVTPWGVSSQLRRLFVVSRVDVGGTPDVDWRERGRPTAIVLHRSLRKDLHVRPANDRSAGDAQRVFAKSLSEDLLGTARSVWREAFVGEIEDCRYGDLPGRIESAAAVATRTDLVTEPGPPPRIDLGRFVDNESHATNDEPTRRTARLRRYLSQAFRVVGDEALRSDGNLVLDLATVRADHLTRLLRWAPGEGAVTRTLKTIFDALAHRFRDDSRLALADIMDFVSPEEIATWASPANRLLARAAIAPETALANYLRWSLESKVSEGTIGAILAELWRETVPASNFFAVIPIELRALAPAVAWREVAKHSDAFVEYWRTLDPAGRATVLRIDGLLASVPEGVLAKLCLVEWESAAGDEVRDMLLGVVVSKADASSGLVMAAARIATPATRSWFSERERFSRLSSQQRIDLFLPWLAEALSVRDEAGVARVAACLGVEVQDRAAVQMPKLRASVPANVGVCLASLRGEGLAWAALAWSLGDYAPGDSQFLPGGDFARALREARDTLGWVVTRALGAPRGSILAAELLLAADVDLASLKTEWDVKDLERELQDRAGRFRDDPVALVRMVKRLNQLHSSRGTPSGIALAYWLVGWSGRSDGDVAAAARGLVELVLNAGDDAGLRTLTRYALDASLNGCAAEIHWWLQYASAEDVPWMEQWWAQASALVPRAELLWEARALAALGSLKRADVDRILGSIPQVDPVLREFNWIARRGSFAGISWEG